MKLGNKPGYQADPRDQWVADNTPEPEKLPIDQPDGSYVLGLNDEANEGNFAAILWIFAGFCVVMILMLLAAMYAIGGLFDGWS